MFLQFVMRISFSVFYIILFYFNNSYSAEIIFEFHQCSYGWFVLKILVWVICDMNSTGNFLMEWCGPESFTFSWKVDTFFKQLHFNAFILASCSF